MYSDADIETAELNRRADTINRLREKGICFHGSMCAPPTGPAKCNDCGKTWTSLLTALIEREFLEAEYL